MGSETWSSSVVLSFNVTNFAKQTEEKNTNVNLPKTIFQWSTEAGKYQGCNADWISVVVKCNIYRQ